MTNTSTTRTQSGVAAKKITKPATRPTLKRAAAKKPPSKKATVPSPVAAPPAKPKLVRDSFTIPKAEYAQLETLKLRAAKLARPTKKSELLRAGIAALTVMNDKAFLFAVSAVPSLKTGRPAQTATKRKHAK